MSRISSTSGAQKAAARGSFQTGPRAGVDFLSGGETGGIPLPPAPAPTPDTMTVFVLQPQTMVSERALAVLWRRFRSLRRVGAKTELDVEGTIRERCRPVLIEQALSGRMRLKEEIRKTFKTVRGRATSEVHVPPRVVIDNYASNTHTVLEVNGRDRPDLLHDVAAVISEQGLQIASAHVTTGVRAVQVFYVKDLFGLKIENDRKLAQLPEALLTVLASP